MINTFELSSALPDIKYNCRILFLCEIYRSFCVCFKIYFLINHHYKTYSELTGMCCIIGQQTNVVVSNETNKDVRMYT